LRAYIPLGRVDLGRLGDDVGETTTNTLDGGEGEGDLLLTLDVGVQNTQHILELVLFQDEGLQRAAARDIAPKSASFESTRAAQHDAAPDAASRATTAQMRDARGAPLWATRREKRGKGESRHASEEQKAEAGGP